MVVKKVEKSVEKLSDKFRLDHFIIEVNYEDDD